MKITKVNIEGLLVIEPQVFVDDRGYFFESYNSHKFSEIGVNVNFLQDNQSMSNKGALRGLHFQSQPFEQGKLVTVIQGAVHDVVVDIRKDSLTYGKYFSLLLDGKSKKMFWIPPGFAHGFETLEDNTIFQYKCTNVYNKASEGGLLWNDSLIAINWVTPDPIISEKDMLLPEFRNFVSPF